MYSKASKVLGRYSSTRRERLVVRAKIEGWRFAFWHNFLPHTLGIE